MTRAIVAVAFLASGCGSKDPPYAYDGRYELVAVETEANGCDGPLQPAAVPDAHRFFRLQQTDLPTGRLMAFYPCLDAAQCSDTYDLYYSFGANGDAWSTSVYAAVKPPCQLSYTLRVLSAIDGATIRIESRVSRQTDPSIAADACTYPLAKSRAASMPCVEREVWTARRRN